MALLWRIGGDKLIQALSITKNKAYFVDEKIRYPLLIVTVRYTSPGGPMFLVVEDNGPSHLVSVNRKLQISPETEIPETKRVKQDIKTIAIKAESEHPSSFKAYFVNNSDGIRTNEAGLVIGFGIKQIAAKFEYEYYVLYKDGKLIVVGEDAEKRMHPEFKIPDSMRLSW